MDKTKKQHDSRISTFAEYWAQLYKAKYGRLYFFAYSKDYATIKRLLKQLDSENAETSLTRLQSAAKALFEGSLKWFKGVETIGSFAKQINHLLDDHGGSSRAGCTVKPTDEQLAAYGKLGG